MGVLDELWSGNIVPIDMAFLDAPGCREARDQVSDADRRLRAALGPEQRLLLDREQDAEDNLSDIFNREMFQYAFCLGAKLTLEVLGPTASVTPFSPPGRRAGQMPPK